MDDGAVRFGLVGYGFGGRYFHAPLLAAAPGVEFLGVVTTSEERRALVAADHAPQQDHRLRVRVLKVAQQVLH